jgi:hypothetical protein
MGVSGQSHSLPRFSPGEGPPVPVVQEAEWAPEPVWTHTLKEKSFRLWRESNLFRPVVQPVARNYTDWATRLTAIKLGKDILVIYILTMASSCMVRRAM